MNQFRSKKPHYEHLRKKWTARHITARDNFWASHGDSLKHFALGSLGGLMLLSSPVGQIVPSNLIVSRDDAIKNFDMNVLLAQSISEKLPKEVRLLEDSEEQEITEILSRDFGFKVTTEIDGIKLNRNYGLIGGEQHLYRYPGDNLYSHAENATDFAKYSGAGIAPGLGAWGYFATSKEEFDETDKLRERYYLAIQTFLVPGYAENVAKYRDFFRFRKMLVVNPVSGQSVVAVIGDSGPSEWTGKHLGGSPEVMDLLGFGGGPRKGAALYFFIDDPKGEIPLGSVKVRSSV